MLEIRCQKHIIRGPERVSWGLFHFINGSEKVVALTTRQVLMEDLVGLPTPEAVGRWFPKSHHDVLREATEALQRAGQTITHQQLLLNRGPQRFVGILTLEEGAQEDLSLIAGITNSIDKSLPQAVYLGMYHRPTAIMLFSKRIAKKKHTRRMEDRFREELERALQELKTFAQNQICRFTLCKEIVLSEDKANSLLLQAFEKKILSAPQLPIAIREWRKPKQDELAPRTLFSLLLVFNVALQRTWKTVPIKALCTSMAAERLVAQNLL